jgi:hypothetical protein
MAVGYGSETTVLDWRERLGCSRCGSRHDMLLAGKIMAKSSAAAVMAAINVVPLRPDTSNRVPDVSERGRPRDFHFGTEETIHLSRPSHG